MRLLRLAALVVALVLACGDAAAAAIQPHAGQRKVSYAGTTLWVPRDWPVHDLAAAPHTCIRYDRHAVYLGHASAEQDCPAPAVGRVATVQIEPDGHVIRTDADGKPEAVPAPGPKSRRRVMAAANFSGLGFDACAAPAWDTMLAWRGTSPYGAAGIYIGGSDRACPDGNLTPWWVRQVSQQGWKLFPIYVGRQAPCWKDPGGLKPPLIEDKRRWTQGEEAANDAADRAAFFGIAPGSPVYFDMEWYPRKNPDCTSDVQAFLSAWTYQLHKRGFVSGIYSSANGAIADITLVYDSGAAYRADAAWFAHWDKTPALFGDATLDDRFWPGSHRIKQYTGGHDETYGGKRLNVDSNVLNAPVAALVP